MPQNRTLSLLLILVLLAGLSAARPPARAAAQDAPPAFEQVPCPLTFAARYSVTCGYVTVPEHYADPAGPTIRVMIAVFASPRTDKFPDAVLMLSGGPGSNTLDSFAGGLGLPLDTLLRRRDVILLDQRGMGYSEPNLNCPEADQARLAAIVGDDSVDQIASLTACRDRLIAEGVNLAAFNTVESAGDVDAVRRALGLDAINIITGSYGSTLTLTAMRHYPEGIRSAVIAAPAPPEIDLIGGFAPNLYHALEGYFVRCADDPACGGQYPTVREDFYALAERLTAQPEEVSLTVRGFDAPVTVKLDALTLYGGIQTLLYVGYHPQIAALITAIANGRYQVIEPMVAGSASSNVVTGAFYSFRCADDVYTTSPEQIDAMAADLPDTLRAAATRQAASYFEACEAWPAARLDPVESQPVTGPVPALFLQGDLDPVSSAEWTAAAAAALDHGIMVRFPDSGHYILGSAPCSSELIAAFINDPLAALPTSCQGWY